MKSKIRGLMQLIKEKQVNAIDLKFTDFPGRWHHVTLPATSLDESLFEEGIGIDASSVHFSTVEKGDMVIIPDPDTMIMDPFWKKPVMSFICDIREADTKNDFSLDPRGVAKRAESFLRESGIAEKSLWSPEYEFHVFDSIEYENSINVGYARVDSVEAEWNSSNTQEGRNLGHKIPHHGGYHAIPPLDSLHIIRQEMVDEIVHAGIPVKYHHHEVGGPGQVEIEVGFDTLCKSADNGMTIKYFIKNTARQFNKTATLMPKPLYNEAGNGMHVHQMLRGPEDAAIFFEKGGYADLSALAESYIAGLLIHAPSLLAFTNPSTNSYKRLVPGFEAPVRIFYSLGNRSSMVRVPKYAIKPDKKRCEFRTSDATCNMYFALAAMLMAGMDGIKRKLNPRELGLGPFEGNAFEVENEQSFRPLPTSLREALQALEEDHDYLLEGGVFNKHLIETWIKFKMDKEVTPVQRRPHPYEYNLYYDV